ncbi:MAG: YidC/Oxa1 family membrane protein insertase [Ruminococcus sp.]|nr:YidC/Oxa1 family membrane protein insertase [Ruminococcus sp.]
MLWALFFVFKNFGVSIIFFTLVIRFIIFPFSIKQQKSMANTARLQKKQKEIREKYANNRQKANEEMQKLYQKEGVSPTSGCLTSIVPMLIMLGIFYSVAYPLTNTLHINGDTVANASSFINALPGHTVSGASGMATYEQIALVKILADSKSLIGMLFSGGDVAKIEMFINGFNFAGFNLLETPSTYGFMSFYILIPILCFVSSVGAQLVTMRINKTGQGQQGCMKFMMIALPLFSAYIAFSVPSAVGFYWIWSSIFSLVQAIIMGKFYGPDMTIARNEAQHVALLEQQEAQVQYSPAPVFNDSKKKK